MELERLRLENDKLLNAILEKPKVVEEKQIDTSELKPIMPGKHLPWAMRRQMLEAEDREKARLMKEAPKPSVESKVSSAEEELLAEN